MYKLYRSNVLVVKEGSVQNQLNITVWMIENSVKVQMSNIFRGMDVVLTCFKSIVGVWGYSINVSEMEAFLLLVSDILFHETLLYYRLLKVPPPWFYIISRVVAD